MLTAISNT